jgi:integrase
MSDLLVVQMSEIARIARWSREQAGALPEAVRGDSLYAFYVLAVTTGMRNGELLALQWRDVDLDAGTPRVRRTVWGGVAITLSVYQLVLPDMQESAAQAMEDALS